MPKFAANLSFMFTEWAFEDRFQAAADAGFAAVEFFSPYDFPPDVIAARIARAGLVTALFNSPPGDWDKGERGLAALADRSEEFKRSIATALDYAKALDCRRVHMLAGIVPHRDERARNAYLASLRYAGEQAAAAGVTIMIEPVNTRDNPGFFLDDFDKAVGFIHEVGLPNVRLEFDIYHRQIIHGDVTTALRKFMPIIGHVQIAGVPERNEPGSGELDDFRLFGLLDELGYDGYVGCEYRPKAGTLAGLGWLRAFDG